MPRGIAASLGILLFILLLSGIVMLIVVQTFGFVDNLPLLQLKFLNVSDDFQFWIAKKFGINTADQAAYISKMSEELVSFLTNSLSSIFLTLAELILWTVFVFIFTYFFLIQRSQLVLFISKFFKEEKRHQVATVILQSREVMQGYVSGLLLELIIVALVNTLAMGIMGNKYAILIGIIVALLNVIPYVGILIGLFITFVITFSFYEVDYTIYTILVLYIIHIIEANFMMPRLIGRRVNLNPFITILAVLFGGIIWGIPGMFLSIPITAMIKVIFKNIESTEHIAKVMGHESKVSKMRRIVIRRWRVK